jgi:hypothetical protein
MKRPPLSRSAPALAAILFLGLSACDPKPTTITGPDTDDQKAALATAKPIALPPSIQASKVYRCKDSSVVYVDYMSDKTSAMVKTKKDGTATTVKSATPGGEMTADGGYSVKGSPDAGSADISVPGHAGQSCTS